MMKYILVLVLFGFFNMSLAHERDWMSCVDKHECEEVNLDHIVSIRYILNNVIFYKYVPDQPYLRKVVECNVDNVRKGKHCLLERGEWVINE